MGPYYSVRLQRGKLSMGQCSGYGAGIAGTSSYDRRNRAYSRLETCSTRGTEVEYGSELKDHFKTRSRHAAYLKMARRTYLH